MNKFKERYSQLETIELIRILLKHEEYQELAVEAAKEELEERKISNDELSELQNTVNQEISEQKAKEQSKIIRTEDFIKVVNPIKEADEHGNAQIDSDSQIKIIAVFFFAVTAYSIFSEFSLLRYIFSGELEHFDISTSYFLFTLLILPIGSILFWKREKSGWYLLVFISIFTVESNSIHAVNLIQMGYSGLLNFQMLISIIVFGGAIWGLNLSKVTEEYSITKKNRNITFVVSGSITLFLVLAIL